MFYYVPTTFSSLMLWLSEKGPGLEQVFSFKAADTCRTRKQRSELSLFYSLQAGLALVAVMLSSLTFPIYSLSIVTNYFVDDKGFVRVGMSLLSLLVPIPNVLFQAVLALGIIGFNLGKGHLFMVYISSLRQP